MNFNLNIIDLENIEFTLMEMKSSIFVLASIAGIHTFTILFWFGYKYLNEITLQTKQNEETENDDIEDDETDDGIEDDEIEDDGIEDDEIENEETDEETDENEEIVDGEIADEEVEEDEMEQDIELYMDEIEIVNEKSVIIENDKNNLEKELYHNMIIFENKNKQLEELIDKLSKIQNNLEIVRGKLTELNNSPTI